MMKNFYGFWLIYIITSCGGNSNEDQEPPIINIPAPLEATLIFPENNTECNEGVINSANDLQSRVTFRWSPSENTDVYDLNIKNLTTNNSITLNSTINELAVNIERGTPYEWFIISKSNQTNETAKSDIFRFYNQGEGIENYAPFPAESVNPIRGSTIESTLNVILKWEASDVDNDIVEYNIFLEDKTPPEISVGITNSKEISIGIMPDRTYYWRIITTDSRNNTSESEIFDFKVK